MTENELHIFADDDGLAVFGPSELVERYMSSTGLAPNANRDIPPGQLSTFLGAASAATQAGVEISQNSGRWMKLTRESARARELLPAVKNSGSGNIHAILRAKNGRFAKNLQFVNTPAVSVTNPAMLGGLSGIMQQLALEQALKEIKDYLALIDEKIEDLKRAHKDSVLADIIGVSFVINEAMTLREHTGKVTEVSWSKLQSTAHTIARSEGYALQQLAGLADKVDSKAKMGHLAKVSGRIGQEIYEWLGVLAYSCQLQDAIAILEIDRVLETDPESIDDYRKGLRKAREARGAQILDATHTLLERIETASAHANTKVLLNPLSARTVVTSLGQTAVSIAEFQEVVGGTGIYEALEAKRWTESVLETKDRLVDSGAKGIEAAKDLGSSANETLRVGQNKFFTGVAAVATRLAGDNEPPLEKQLPAETTGDKND